MKAFKMRPEAHGVWAPGAFQWLPDAMRDLIAEAEKHGRDVEFLSEHRKEGEFAIMVRIAPTGTERVLDLPPMVVKP